MLGLEEIIKKNASAAIKQPTFWDGVSNDPKYAVQVLRKEDYERYWKPVWSDMYVGGFSSFNMQET